MPTTLDPHRDAPEIVTRHADPALRDALTRSIDELVDAAGPQVRTGLTTDDSAARLATYGRNELPMEPPRPAWKRFADQFREPLIYVLVGAAVLAAIVGDPVDSAVIAVVLMINALLGYVQEGRAESALESLRSMLVPTTRVRRDGLVLEIDATELVPGDLVVLETGDRIPADGRFVECVAIRVDESSLTGESDPVPKTVDALVDDDVPLGDQRNAGFMNTTVVAGRGTLLVMRTGPATEMGRINAMVQSAEQVDTPLQVQLATLGKRLAAIAVVAAGIVFAVAMFQGSSFADAMLNAIALAVAAIPEGLPAVVTVTLAVGVNQLSLRKAIVKRLASVETLGSTSVICSDKTGTLTRNQMTVTAVVLGDVRIDLHDDPDAPELFVQPDGQPPHDREDLRAAVLPGLLCNDATSNGGVVVGEPTEAAIISLTDRLGISTSEERQRRPRLGEVPFDSAKKFMATFHAVDEAPTDDSDAEAPAADRVLICAKGAPDVLLARCRWFIDGDGERRPLDDAARARFEARNEELAADGRRVLALASRTATRAEVFGPDGEVLDHHEMVDDLELRALVGIVDPPRLEARDAIRLCHKAGIDVKMITGDHPSTAAAIAKALGLEGDVVSGPQLDEMDDDELAARIDAIAVCARVSPEHKVRIVTALARNGHIVAMTGDGVNDAAALRTAHIGVAMGITGTDVAKEAADVVLTDDNFATIVAAVEGGRSIYDNIAKFVRFQLTTNLAAIATILTASLAGLPVPLTAIQVLWVNIITDGPPAMTLGVDPPRADTMSRPPRSPDEHMLDRARFFRLLPTAVTMTIGTLAMLVVGRELWGEQVALTATFTVFVLFQLANVFNARSEDRSVFSRASLSNRSLWLVVLGVLIGQILVVTVEPLRELFDTVALDATQWAACVAMALTVVVVDEIRKAILRLRSR
jgi:Ca2+-transporting ATPase